MTLGGIDKAKGPKSGSGAGHYLWGVTARPSHFQGQRRLVPVSANTTLLVDVEVALYAP
jgi:hypothetical protein